MGVPKFYRWISERYPCLSEVVKEYQIPEFDNLYLDMNGVVHVCSHPEDNNPHFRITEEKIYQDIFHYIEVLFRLIKPKKVFFMAIDGVAPRAKMNQQRGRRFRSAREAEDLVRKALEKGETMPTQERFDSNCITPGTEFMAKLQEGLKYFVAKKVTTDTNWQGIKIFLSGHETPGEGEHKVMDYIRYIKSADDYDANTRHCLYGLDADLMMLGLASHEPHFSLLREEVRFGGKKDQKRSTAPEETVFHLLHLSLFREYLDFEFQELKKPGKLSFPYDLERIIDDWVLMGFLVGNDFIPHLPHMHIHTECLPMLWRIYEQVLPTLDGYLQEHGTINLRRLEVYLKVLAQNDVDSFQDTYADIKWLESKSAGKNINEEAAKAAKEEKLMKKSATIGADMQRSSIEIEEEMKPDDQTMKKSSSIGSDLTGIPTAHNFMKLKQAEGEEEDEDLMKAMGGMTLEEYEEGLEEDDQIDWDAGSGELFDMEFRHHKNGYYMTKMKYPKVTPEVLREQATGYVKALQWILYYYYCGVPSWSWYYEHHYAPYLSDVKDFADMEMEFDISKPFLPFQQLMAVLPAASKNLMPKPLQTLMINETSPIHDFYPTDFETDLNGKQQEWEAVVLIPFIEEERLITAMKTQEEKMTDEEKSRNQHGPHLLFEFTDQEGITYDSPLPGKFPDIFNCKLKKTEVHKHEFAIARSKINTGLCKDVRLDLYFPGFPTLKHLKHTAMLSKEGVKIFQSNSRGFNMILTLENVDKDTDVNKVVEDYLGKEVHVDWPHLQEVKVIAVCDNRTKYSLVEEPKRGGKGSSPKTSVYKHDYGRDESITWGKRVDDITDRYRDRRGVDVGPTYILLECCVMTGRKYVCGHSGNITLEKQWAKTSTFFALQTSVKDLAVKDPSFKQYRTLDELFPPKSDVFMLGFPHYGCMGQVLEIDPNNDGRIRVEFVVPEEPDLETVLRKGGNASQKYFVGYHLANQLGISSHLLSRVTGSLMLFQGSKGKPIGNNSNRLNVGLNLKFNKTNMEVPGYTMKDPDTNQWLYSRKLQNSVQEYIEKFPELFDYVARNINEDNYYEEDVFGEETADKMKELKTYLKELDCKNIAPSAQGSKVTDEGVIKDIEATVDALKAEKKKKKRLKMQIRPHLLFRPLDAQAQLVPDTSAEHQMFDRVINVRAGYTVPLGARGTVTGIMAAPKEQDVVFEVVFDEAFLGGLTLRCSQNRGYRMPATAFINISFGIRKDRAKNDPDYKPTAVVKPQQGYQGNRRDNNSYAAAANSSGGYSAMRGSNGNRRQGQGHQDNWRGQGQDNWRGQGQPQSQGAYSLLKNTRGNQNQQPSQENWRGQGQQFDQGQRGQGQNFRGQDQRRGGQGQRGYGGQDQGQVDIRQQGNYGQRPNGNEVQNQAQPQIKPQEINDEFLNLWQQLQQPPPGMAPPTTAASLQHAAMALKASEVVPQVPQQSTSTQQHNAAPSKSGQNINQNANDAGMQKIDLGKLFGGDAVAVGPTSADQSNQEFADLLRTLQAPSQQVQLQQQKEGTQALQQMLKVGGANMGGADMGGANVGAATVGGANPAFGKQVSVDELFQGASNKMQKKQNVQKTPPQQQQQQRSNKLELHSHCTSMHLMPPVYTHQPGRDNKVCALVHVGPNVFKGSYVKSPAQAEESAAGVALLQLKGPSEHGHQRFTSSPDSAFRPVHSPGSHPQGPPPPPGGYLGPNGQRQQQPPPQHSPWFQGPGFQQRAWQQQQQQQQHPNWFQGGPGQFHGGGGPPPQFMPGPPPQFMPPRPHHPQQQQPPYHPHQQQQQPYQPPRKLKEAGTLSSITPKGQDYPKTPSKTPNKDTKSPGTPSQAFVPTQVQLKQKTPQRDIPSKSSSSVTMATENPTTTGSPRSTTDQAAQPAAQKKLFAAERTSQQQGMSSSAAATGASPGKPARQRGASGGDGSGNKQNKQPRRPRSRIAANFGNK